MGGDSLGSRLLAEGVFGSPRVMVSYVSGAKLEATSSGFARHQWGLGVQQMLEFRRTYVVVVRGGSPAQ